MSTPDERAAVFLAAITYLRIALTPVVMAMVLARDPATWVEPTAALLFAFAAATDFFDGRLARRWKQTSTFGSFIDTAADKLLVSGVLLALVAVDRASPWVAFVIVGRELLIMGLRGAVSASDGLVVTPSMWGKWKATIQFVAITFAIWRPDIRIGDWFLDQWLMAFAAAVTIISAVQYLARFLSVLSRRDQAVSDR
ncbi:MAG TPA: CDP-diacylglycerol--glycerol-3-phosphate 3-phosphatidyltransferase [Actinomycetota bacterium]|jgi:CDP-diacylglycerol--glycerol-3-phosphate 3-phosphatidyltransferase|nr:CDP-diacylglycerol--glycerol-3-phosphate 3-phosphatidyltransferase [Actinomycetota bacterium]